ncbi:MAG TPA: SBBP repeat-containing protein [Chthonomonadales bacterium]|nr:SBBP repeat-containing protein [Chthonomonadales bacterium]
MVSRTCSALICAVTLLFISSGLNAQQHLMWRAPLPQAGRSPGIITDIGGFALDANDNAVVTGTLNDGQDSNNDVFTSMVTSAGYIDLNLLYDGAASGNDYGNAIALDGAGNAYVAGTYDANTGALLWSHLYGATYPTALMIDAQGDPIVLAQGNNAIQLFKFNPTGQVIWQRHVAIPSGDYSSNSVFTVDSAGNMLLACGLTNSSLRTTTDLLYKYAPNGVVLWERTLASSSSGTWNGPTGITTDSSGAVIMNVSRVPATIGYPVQVVLKYSSTGQFLWSRSFPDAGEYPGASSTNAVVTDSNDNIIATCTLGGTVSVTQKYDSSGNLLWTGRYGVSSSSPCVAVDSGDNIYTLVYWSPYGVPVRAMLLKFYP